MILRKNTKNKEQKKIKLCFSKEIVLEKKELFNNHD